MSEIAYGLDLAGYSTKKSGLARATRSGDSIRVEIAREHAFKRERRGTDRLADVVRSELSVVQRCLEQGSLLVDVPIDLQQLPHVEHGVYVWQTAKRPVDQAFKAMSPLANLIGAVVSRFWQIRRQLEDSLLGTRLWETYPAGSLGLLGVTNKKYKDQSARRESGGWVPVSSDPKKRVLASLLNELGWLGEAGLEIDDDGFDAAVCAVTGVAADEQRLEGKSLAAAIQGRLGVADGGIACEGPRGYVLLATQPAGRVWLTTAPTLE